MKISWLKAAPLLALNAVFWIAYAVMVGVLWVIGVPLIRREAKALNFEYQPSRVWPPESRRVVRWRRAWMNPVWGNEQDGIDGLPYDDEHTFVGSLTWWPNKSFRSVAERIIEWSALRNSTNNLRFMHYFVPWLGWLNPNTIEPRRIRWRGTEAPLDAVLLKGGCRRGRMSTAARAWCTRPSTVVALPACSCRKACTPASASPCGSAAARTRHGSAGSSTPAWRSKGGGRKTRAGRASGSRADR